MTIITTEYNTMDMPRLYKAADCFVLPTRGEGWGVPIMEAMAMELPTIATNWSGPVDFINDDVSYPIPITGLTDKLKWDSTGRLAEPDVQYFKKLLRHVYTHREEAKQKGIKARKHIVQNFSREAVSKVLVEHFKRIETIIHK